MFIKANPDGYRTLVAGVDMKPLAYGEKTLLVEVRLQKGYTIPLHSHPHEQTGYLVQGQLRFSVGGEVFEARPGDSWSIHGGVEHMVLVMEDSLAVEVFSPVRQEYLARS